jgi:hypothetical protein
MGKADFYCECTGLLAMNARVWDGHIIATVSFGKPPEDTSMHRR